MSLAIRSLGLSDESMVGELLDLFGGDWSDALSPGASGPRAFLADSRNFMFGAFDDNEPVGWLWGVHVRRPTGQVMSYVHEVDVVAAARRRGIGTLLMQSALDEARRNGGHRLWLITDEDNEHAQGLYQSIDGTHDNRSWVRFRWDF